MMFWNQAIWRTPARLMTAGTHSPNEGNAPVLHAARIVEVEQGIDVEHPGRDDGRVAGPGLDPVAPADEVAGEVAELVAGVGVQPAVAVGDPLGELAEQHGQEHRADGDHGEHGDPHRAGTGQHGGMVNTPVPTMLPMTSPVAEVSPRACAFCRLRSDSVASASIDRDRFCRCRVCSDECHDLSLLSGSHRVKDGTYRTSPR